MARSAASVVYESRGVSKRFSRVLVEFAADQDAKSFPVLGASCRDDFGRQLGAGRGFRPADAFEVIANKLFVERGLRAAGLVLVGGPEAGGIGSEGFVDPDEIVAEKAELEFCVGEENAARSSVSSGAAVDFEAEVADFAR